MAALAAEPRVPEVDRDRWRRQSYEEGPPDGDARFEEVAPEAGFSSVPHVALPNNDGDAVKTICRIVGFPDGKAPEQRRAAPDAELSEMDKTTKIHGLQRLGA